MQSHARVVVVGGGCVGANILYSLAKRGWTDVALLERTELTAGSTWHAAGLVPLYSFSYSFGRLIAKSIEIYESLEGETGQSVGWHKCGQLACREHTRAHGRVSQLCEHRRDPGRARRDPHAKAGPRAVAAVRWARDMLGGVYNPDDGHIAPADVTQAAAKGARD